MAKLIIYEGKPETSAVYETFNLSENRILIGADPENQLILDSPEIDSTHASLELRDNHWFLQDLGGPGGTSINGQLIEGPHMLHHGDEIELGPIKIKFHHREPGATRDFSQQDPAYAGQPNNTGDTNQNEYVSGRVWFAGVAGATLIVILVILSLAVLAHIFGFVDMTALFGG